MVGGVPARRASKRRRTETDMHALRKTEAVAECFTGRAHRKREGRYRLYLPSLYGFRAVRPRCFFRLSDQYIPPFRTSIFSPFREANRKVNFCRFFKGSRRFSAVQKLSVHPPIVYAVLRKFTAFWRKLWRKFCAHIRGWPQPVQTPFRRTHSCCGCRHPR